MSEKWPYVDVLVTLEGARGNSIYLHPDHPPGLKPIEFSGVDFLAKRREGLLPFGELAAERYLVLEEDPVTHLRHITHGTYVISDAFRALLEPFDCPRLEFIPADGYRVHNWPEDREDIMGRGEPLGRYWIMNCYNNYDLIDKEKTVGTWYWPLQSDLVRSLEEARAPEYRLSSPDDPPELSGHKRLVLTAELPQDAIFGLVGLPQYRFVSEAFFDAVVRSGFVDPPGTFNFSIVQFRNDVEVFAGYFIGRTEYRAPYRLNCRTIYWGGFQEPLDFVRPPLPSSTADPETLQ